MNKVFYFEDEEFKTYSTDFYAKSIVDLISNFDKDKDLVLKIENVSYRYSDALEGEYVFKDLNYEFYNGKL